jgi:hypothetical protein
MSDETEARGRKQPPANVDPEMRREVSRRLLITDELGRAGLRAVKQLPGIGGLLGMAFRQSESERDETLLRALWKLVVGREGKPEEFAAGAELLRNAKTPDEKGDALVDVLWALCQTTEFEELNRSDLVMVRGLYLIAREREPTEAEQNAALAVLSEIPDTASRGAAFEGLLSGLLRSSESIFYKKR